MLKVSILGMEDGDHVIHASCPAESIPEMFPEFTGEVVFDGMVQKQGKRLIVNAHATCNAVLTCDVSGEDFEMLIEAPINKHFRLDTQLFNLQTEDDGDEILLSEDEEYIDITEEVRQELAIHLPMKRVSPNYVNVQFETLHPELLTKQSENTGGDSPFAALKHLNIQKN